MLDPTASRLFLLASSEDNDHRVAGLGLPGLVDGDDAVPELPAAWLVGQRHRHFDGGSDVLPRPGGPLAPHDAVGSVCLGPCYADIKSGRKRCETIVPRSLKTLEFMEALVEDAFEVTLIPGHIVEAVPPPSGLAQNATQCVGTRLWRTPATESIHPTDPPHARPLTSR